MFDLFGEVVVTDDDISAWVHAVAPAFCSSDRRMSYYVENWHVAEKVRRAKLDGTFDDTIENARSLRAHLFRRFGLR